MKKILSIILVVILVLGMACFSVSADNTVKNMDKAKILKELNLFAGTDKGFELEKSASRIEGAIVFLRIIGKEFDASHQTNKHPFKDIPKWADAYIGYMYKNNLSFGKSATQFGSSDSLTANQYATFILRALGYDDTKGDFSYNKALEKANQIGLLSSKELDYYKNNQKFLRDDLVGISYNALKVKLKGSNKTLATKLVENFVFSKSLAIKYDLFNNTINIPTEDKVYANDLNYNLASKVNNDVFYIYRDRLYKQTYNGGNSQQLTSSSVSYPNINGDWIYYSAWDSNVFGNLYKVKTDGSQNTKIDDGTSIWITSDSNWIYYISINDTINHTGNIYKIKPDGTNKTEIVNGKICKLFLSNNYLYYIDKKGYLHKIKTDGTEKIDFSIPTQEIAIIGDWIIYTDEISISALKNDNSDNELILSNVYPSDINVEGDWIYFTNYNENNQLYKVKINGTQLTKIDNVSNIQTINIVGDWIYYRPLELMTTPPFPIYKVKKDGTEKQIVR